jgi:phenylalanyl-tRNA synthetase beta chain
MNISYNWLKDLIEIDLPPAELAEKLTNAGHAVEGIHEAEDDFVFDIDLTSNRPDCLSHRGIAREAAAITGSKIKEQSSKPKDPTPGKNNGLVTIVDSDLCHRFTARIIRNVKIAPSPDWLVKRLEAIGERAINNVADITNYVMHELGQPMHSFDLNKLAEGRIVVRRAKPGETITTLDEVERKLDTTMLAICDAEKPVAVGGVMGGLDSAISDATTGVLLEVAYFKRENIRQTSRKLGLATEASYRFERGVDIENLVRASNRATELICELAGGEAGEFVDVYPTKFVPNEIVSEDIQYATKRLTGLDIETAEILRILDGLGISSRDGKDFTSPSWRHDLAIEEDLVEEAARIYGYDKIAEELPPAYGAGELQPAEPRKIKLRQNLSELGFDEAISYSFIDTKFDATFETLPGIVDENAEEDFVTLQDAVIEGAVRMRPSLLSGLLDAVRTNLNQQRRDVKLFEIGKVFASKTGEDNLPTEKELFSVVLTGGEVSQGRAMVSRELDFYDLKGAVEAALESVGLRDAEFSAEDVKHLRKGQSASISLGGKKIGYLGRVSDDISAGYKFRQPVYVAELDLQAAMAEDRPPGLYRPLAKYPSIVRDVSLLVKRTTSLAEIRKAITDQGAEICRSVEFVDIYEGKGMAEDERSVTIRLSYRSDERTLIETEVDAIHQQIIGNLQEIVGLRQRF